MTENTTDLRTRVIIGTNSIYGTTQTHTMAYMPDADSNGEIYVDNNGNISRLIKLGGVKVGTEGRILGMSAKAYRSNLIDYEKNTSLGPDLIEMIAIEIPEYQKTAWFPVEKIRVVGN